MTPPEDLRTTGQIIWDTISDLHAQEQIVTREVLATVTGYKMTVIDDHVRRMVDDGRLARVKAGVFVPVPQYPAPRAVSITDLPDGMTLIEVGDDEIRVWPKERRAIARNLAGDVLQMASIRAADEAGFLAAELLSEVKRLRHRVKLLEAANGTSGDDATLPLDFGPQPYSAHPPSRDS